MIEPMLNNKTIVWLYCDRDAIMDNAYYQFIHDVEINDGVARYYVTSLERRRWKDYSSPFAMKHVIRFGSYRHKLYMLKASLLLLAYIETSNWQPFSPKAIKGLGDLLRYKTVYLQHGVLHAHMPWKYSFDRLDIDYEVVSTQYEIDNLTARYGFPRSALLDSGMPRYDKIEGGVQIQRKEFYLFHRGASAS